ncbi:MAG: hypothetical protein HFG69_01570 [Hungatella sp.]|nr:hypothetical protein [Hungatella sp.]
MKSRKQKELDRNFIDEKLAEAFGYGDEQLEGELDRALEAAKEDRHRAPEGELQRIMDRLDYDSEGVSKRKAVRIRRLVKYLVAAAVLGAMVIGGGMWVGAKRYYVQETRGQSNMMIINNEPDNVNLDNTFEKNKVYTQIEDELGIEAMELSYLPDKLLICGLTITEKKSVIEFSDGANNLFLYQGQNRKPRSLGYASDAQEFEKVYNLYFDEEFPIYRESLENGETEFGVWIIRDDVYYILYGVIDIEEFKQIVYGIRPYRKYILED